MRARVKLAGQSQRQLMRLCGAVLWFCREFEMRRWRRFLQPCYRLRVARDAILNRGPSA